MFEPAGEGEGRGEARPGLPPPARVGGRAEDPSSGGGRWDLGAGCRGAPRPALRAPPPRFSLLGGCVPPHLRPELGRAFWRAREGASLRRKSEVCSPAALASCAHSLSLRSSPSFWALLFLSSLGPALPAESPSGKLFDSLTSVISSVKWANNTWHPGKSGGLSEVTCAKGVQAVQIQILLSFSPAFEPQYFLTVFIFLPFSLSVCFLHLFAFLIFYLRQSVTLFICSLPNSCYAGRVLGSWLHTDETSAPASGSPETPRGGRVSRPVLGTPAPRDKSYCPPSSKALILFQTSASESLGELVRNAAS